MKRTTLEEIFDAINHKATFFANMLKSQKLCVPYEELKTAYVKKNQEAIKDYVETMLNSYQTLTTGTEACPRKIALLASCLTNYRGFQPFSELAEDGLNNNMDLLTFLLSFDMHQVDKQATLLIGIPIIMLDKLANLLRLVPEEHQRIKILKLVLGSRSVDANFVTKTEKK
jgi:hypothetical protein